MHSSTPLASGLQHPITDFSLNIRDLQAVIFDVDGTLYHLERLYRKMYLELVKYYARHPCKLQDVWILHHFIQQREKQTAVAIADLATAQYEWAAQKTKASLERVQRVVQQWVFEMPLDHIYECRNSETIVLFETLAKKDIATAVFSDYPAQAKLSCLGLSPQCVVSSTDSNVNRLKPDPTGLLVVVDRLGAAVQNCLFIGDRDDRDGECARRAGMPYLILNKNLKLSSLFAALKT